MFDASQKQKQKQKPTGNDLIIIFRDLLLKLHNSERVLCHVICLKALFFPQKSLFFVQITEIKTMGVVLVSVFLFH